MTTILPKIVYRITRSTYATSTKIALSGEGGLYDSGRWHSQGQRIIYTGESSTICLLERLVHADEWIAERSPDRVILTLNLPPISFTHYSAEDLASVDPNWREEGNPLCRRLGDGWLDQAKYCALIVPSAADPMARNVLINPAHAAAATVLASNADLKITPIDLDDRVVSLAHKRRASGAG